MSSMVIHSYVVDGNPIPLSYHHFRTLMVIHSTSLAERLKVIARRLKWLGARDLEVMYEILLLPAFLHDIGKAMKLYQAMPPGWGNRYTLHETVSTIIVDRMLFGDDEIADYILDKIDSLTQEELKLLVLMPILHHHYSFRDPISESERFIVKNSSYSEYFMVDLNDVRHVLTEQLDLITNYTSNLGFLVGLIKKVIDRLGKGELVISKALVKGVIDKLVRIETGSFRDSGRLDMLRLYASAITGITAVADYTSGSLERSGCRVSGYPLHVLSNREIEVVKRIACS